MFGFYALEIGSVGTSRIICMLHITEEPHANATVVREQSLGGMTQ